LAPLDARPVIVALAGPNGAGKTTFYHAMAEKLAIGGGNPILTRDDYKNWPVITEDDRRFVNEVLDSGIVAGATGRRPLRCRRNGATFTGSKYCLTTGSGTAALHMALAAVDVGRATK
jgi:perosamine synthetase